MNKTAIVVGSGFGGISAALRLKSLGYEVSIYEKLNQLGGRARVFKKSGFTFDAGPTVITAPFLFNELFELFKKNREKYVKFVELDPWYRFYFSSNKKISPDHLPEGVGVHLGGQRGGDAQLCLSVSKKFLFQM